MTVIIVRSRTLVLQRVVDSAVFDGDVSPVFRISPYNAEERKKKRGKQSTQILFLDEGNDCRSVLGAAILNELIKGATFSSEVRVSSASIGSTGQTIYAPELLQVSNEMGIDLEDPANHTMRVFQQDSDPVDNDLLLVMDRFDQEEVYKDISILDTINPGGYYSSKLKLLGEFCSTVSHIPDGLDVMEISDPWYGMASKEERVKAMQVAGRKLLMGCQGLITYLSMLKSRCLFGISLQLALTQSLRCPVFEHSSLARAARMRSWKPIWTSNSLSNQFYTVKDVDGEMCVVRKNMSPRKSYNYWKDITNVDREILKWMDQRQKLDRLPKHSELRETGYYSLSYAIGLHGGSSVFSSRLNLPSTNKKRLPSGYWHDVKNVESELKAWMTAYNCAIFPSRVRLKKTGYHGLASALSTHGGIEIFAKRLDIPLAYRGRHYWKDDDNFKTEILPYITQVPSLGIIVIVDDHQGKNGKWYIPSQKALLEASRADLMGAIIRRGGLSKVAKQFGWHCRRMHGRRFPSVEDDIRTLVKRKNLQWGCMPTAAILEKEERSDLVSEIKYFGGFRAVANRIGWSCQL